MIALSIVLTGILYNFLERLGGQGSADDRQPDSMAALFLASITFTGHFEFKVRNHIGVDSVIDIGRMNQIDSYQIVILFNYFLTCPPFIRS